MSGLENIDDDLQDKGVLLLKITSDQDVSKYNVDELPAIVFIEDKVPTVFQGDETRESAVLKWLLKEAKDEDVVEEADQGQDDNEEDEKRVIQTPKADIKEEKEQKKINKNVVKQQKPKKVEPPKQKKVSIPTPKKVTKPKPKVIPKSTKDNNIKREEVTKKPTPKIKIPAISKPRKERSPEEKPKRFEVQVDDEEPEEEEDVEEEQPEDVDQEEPQNQTQEYEQGDEEEEEEANVLEVIDESPNVVAFFCKSCL